MAKPPIAPKAPMPQVATAGSLKPDAVQRVLAQTHDRLADLEARTTDLHDLSGSVGPAVAAVSSGRLLGVQVLTGTGTYAPSAGTSRVRLRMVGGGGGGSGAASGVGTVMAGGGGNSGWLVECLVGSGSLSGGAFSCGAGGAAGAQTGGPGGTGGDTTLVLNGVTYTAKGGTGGVNLGAGSGNGLDGGPSSPAVQPTLPGLVRSSYGLGGLSWVFSGAVSNSASGPGGTTELGAGGAAVGAQNSNGIAGAGLGSGGSGATAGGGGVQAVGGAGAPGGIVIEEMS